VTKAVEVKCEIVSGKTMQAGNFRFTLDIPPIYMDQALWLMEQSVKTGTVYRIVISEDYESEQNYGL
jgi:hypothetical protein